LIEKNTSNISIIIFFKIIPKKVGRGVITINDLCLSLYGTTEFSFSVVEAVDIHVEIVDKFQLGSIVKGYLTVIDNNGDNLLVSHHELINLMPIISNKVLSVRYVLVRQQLYLIDI
jgi:hypothetical protein